MFKLPPAIQPIFDTLYGEDKWYRVWAMIMTACLVFCIPKNTRRMAAIAFVSLGVCAIIWNYLQTSYKQYTPDDSKDNHPKKVKKWLH